MTKKTLAAAAVISASAVSAQAATWEIDKAHSTVGFSVQHMVITKVTGRFDQFEGTIEFDTTDLSSGTAEMTVQMASVNTDNERRDNHLRSPDFFDVEKYPTMTFRSTKVSAVKGDKFQLTGMLTLKDVTKEVTFDCTFNGMLTDSWGNVRAGFTAKGEIDRQDYHVSWSKVLDNGGLVAGDNVSIDIELELVEAKGEADSGK